MVRHGQWILNKGINNKSKMIFYYSIYNL